MRLLFIALIYIQVRVSFKFMHIWIECGPNRKFHFFFFRLEYLNIQIYFSQKKTNMIKRFFFLMLALDVCDDRTACKALLKLNFCFSFVLASCFFFSRREIERKMIALKTSLKIPLNKFYKVYLLKTEKWCYNFTGNCLIYSFFLWRNFALSFQSLKWDNQIKNCNFEPVHLKETFIFFQFMLQK